MVGRWWCGGIVFSMLLISGIGLLSMNIIIISIIRFMNMLFMKVEMMLGSFLVVLVVNDLVC